MSLIVNLKINSSPEEKIGKSLTTGEDFSCLLKDNCSILRPVIDINTSSDISGYNYMYIGAFNRYYYIDDIVSLHNNMWRISGHVDVLETYKEYILETQAVVKRQTNLYNTYLNDPEWKVYANEQVTAHKFANSPFTKALSPILIVAGA